MTTTSTSRRSSNVLFSSDYKHLREHFQNEHFLCTEGDCVNEQFTSVFRTEIDLKGELRPTN